jgi:Tfp pilus assembly protein PilF
MTAPKNIPAKVLVLVIFLTGIMLLYANTLSSPFTFDDSQILSNYFIAQDSFSLENLDRIRAMSPNKWRIFPNISFALNYYLGGSEVFGYHLLNIIIHIAATFIFYLLAQATLNLPVLAGRFQRSTEIAFTAALLWAVHPLQTNAVTYIVQRMTSMATLFFLLAMLCYVKARITEDNSRRIILFAATFLLGVMALFSKENSGMLPVMILGYEFFFLAGPTQDKKDRKALLFLGGGVLALFLVICLFFLGSNPFATILSGYDIREFTLGQRLLTETRIVIHYLSLMVLPLPARLNLAYDFQLSTGFFTPPGTMPAIIGLTVLTGLIFLLYRRDRLTAFGIFWLLGNRVVESSVIALELIFEHRMYMPSMFIILAGTAWLYRLTADRIKTARLVSIGILLLLTLFTWQRNGVWKDGVTLWTDAVNKAPGSVRVYGNLGLAYIDSRKYDTAKEYLAKAVDIALNDKSGNFSYETRIQYLAIAHDNLALAHRETGNYDKALFHAEEALKLEPRKSNALITLGITYSKLGQDLKAFDYFSKASDEGIVSVDLYNNWAVSCFKLGMVDKAIQLLKNAIRLQPDHAESHYNLGIAYSSKGMLKEAQEEMERAMRLREK